MSGIKLSEKATKSLNELKFIGGVTVPALKKNTNMYQIPIEELLHQELLTYYLDAENGDDANSGLSRSKPMKTPVEVIKASLLSASSKRQLVILNALDSENNVVTFDGNLLEEQGKQYPFTITICENEKTSLLFTNGLSIGAQYINIKCLRDITFTMGSGCSASVIRIECGGSFLATNGSSISAGDIYAKCVGNFTSTNGTNISAGTRVIKADNILLNNLSEPLSGSLIHLESIRETSVNSGGVILAQEFRIIAGTDAIFKYFGSVSCHRASIVAAGDVMMCEITINKGIDITAKNIIQIENSGDIKIGDRPYEPPEDPTVAEFPSIWKASNSIKVQSLYANLSGKEFKLECHTLDVWGGFITASGDLFIDCDVLKIGNNIRNGNDTPLNLTLNAKRAIFDSETSSFISVVSPLVEGYSVVNITIDDAPPNGYISLGGRLNSVTKIDRIKGNFRVYLAPSECVENGSDRILIEAAKNVNVYDEVIGFIDSQLTGDFGLSKIALKRALESSIVKTIYLQNPIYDFEEDIVLGCEKAIYGERLSYSGTISGSHEIKFYCDLYCSGAVFNTASSTVYTKRVRGDASVIGTCEFRYELIEEGGNIRSTTASSKVYKEIWTSTFQRDRYLDVIPYNCCTKANVVGCVSGMDGHLTYFSPSSDFRINSRSVLKIRYPLASLPTATGVKLCLYRMYTTWDDDEALEIKLIASGYLNTVVNHYATSSQLILLDHGGDTTGFDIQSDYSEIILKEGGDYMFAIYATGEMASLGITLDSEIQNVCNKNSLFVTGLADADDIPFTIRVDDVCGVSPTYTIKDASDSVLNSVVVSPSNKINYGQIWA